MTVGDIGEESLSGTANTSLLAMGFRFSATRKARRGGRKAVHSFAI